jgi:hypothetical protein
MLRMLAPLLLVAACALAQGPQFDPELQRFLELTPEQLARIVANNRSLSERQGSSGLRRLQLMREAQQELAKPAPDAMVVGGRYAEAERLCRDQLQVGKQTLELNRAVLTDAQRQKLAALQESARLASVVREAQNANLYRMARSSLADFLLGGAEGGSGIIAVPPSLVFRPGDLAASCGGIFIPIPQIVVP